MRNVGGTDYRVMLRDPSGVELMMSELRETEGVSRVTTMKTEDQSEL